MEVLDRRVTVEWHHKWVTTPSFGGVTFWRWVITREGGKSGDSIVQLELSLVSYFCRNRTQCGDGG